MAEIKDDIWGWRRWGPYLSDRSWGTVREDYSASGDAWSNLPYDLARSKAYRWGEDGIAGISDRYQLLCFAPAFWNERDPHLKERFFGVSPHEGNHGEDVKEYYFHVDNLPSHAYMRLLYKYPQRAFPYQQLIDGNRARHGMGPELELLDTGAFDEDRYFDIDIEYAKASTEDLVVRITVTNHGPDAAPLWLLPTLWFRNTWSWGPTARAQPSIALHDHERALAVIADDSACGHDASLPVHYRLGSRILFGPLPGADLEGHVWLCDNESNAARLYGPHARAFSAHPKDAISRALCDGNRGVLKSAPGTKAALAYRFVLDGGARRALSFRLSDAPRQHPLHDVDQIIATRKREADAFFAAIAPVGASLDERHVQRRAIAGLLWTKQSYIFDVGKWLDGDNPEWAPPPERKTIRNTHWRHLNSLRVMTVPDKWEYPWFAAWDLAFQCVSLALVDAKFAKEQLWLLLFEQFQHPSGQLPAYEWEFSDLNPPVHAWAVWRVYNMERIKHGVTDREWLERCFHKLLINFASWVNKVDREGNNVFEGGFLGLDNITVIDRSERVRDGAVLEQSDATGWMGMFCLNLMRIALELAKKNPVYQGLASKFFQHYIYVAYAMKHMGSKGDTLFDAHDGFFYDVMRYPDGSSKKFRVRSLVGLIPLFAVERLERAWIEPFSEFRRDLDWFLKNRADMVDEVVHTIEGPDGGTTHLLTIVKQDQLRRMLEYLHDPAEFLSRYGVRSLSKRHELEPFELDGRSVRYEPAESDSKIKGGNSNWRGPLWFPTTFLLIESLRKLGTAFGPSFHVTAPHGDGAPSTLRDMARDVARRMIAIFLVGEDGTRPVWGHADKFATDPRWRDELLFYEYFHGDNGAGIGASHQTGWTALVANLIDEWR
ncbi:MAG: glucosidase [Deltaproteobacteria bacterium]|nr:glucosidase [Deltaproteobacteria bacterium]